MLISTVKREIFMGANFSENASIHSGRNFGGFYFSDMQSPNVNHTSSSLNWWFSFYQYTSRLQKLYTKVCTMLKVSALYGSLFPCFSSFIPTCSGIYRKLPSLERAQVWHTPVTCMSHNSLALICKLVAKCHCIPFTYTRSTTVLLDISIVKLCRKY